MGTQAVMKPEFNDQEVEQEENDPLAITQQEYRDFDWEIENQPYWRATADKEMDYGDGNQLDSELLRAMKERGIPPAVENMIGRTLQAVRGFEKKTRTDWRVTPNSDVASHDIADAINYKLNEAERHSQADRACSEAFKPQLGCGLGWVEVTRNPDPFGYPYKCLSVHRNQIHWDMKCEDWLHLSDARYLRRRRWLSPTRLAMVFPQHRELIMTCGRAGAHWWTDIAAESFDGGASTGLQNAWNEARAWTMDESRWYDPSSHELCITEFWYRRWVEVPVLKTPDGRVVEYDKSNMAHAIAVGSGQITPFMATVTRLRRSYWMGQHLLYDGESPFPFRHFPYVPFWGFREDMTGIPYGYIRDMKYAQDALNSAIAKLRWGIGVVRVERTKGAVDMTDAQLRRQIARPDADIVLNAEHMATPGSRFDVHRDYTLTDQHFQMMDNNRSTIQRVSNITAGFMGQQGNATSGRQEDTQVEQATQSLEDMMDNFRAARSQVGELLMSMIIEDIGNKPTQITIEGNAVKQDRTVVLNAPEQDPITGMTYLSNDLQRTRLQVALEEVPSSNSYRGQQLNAMSEAVKSLPAEYQAAALPFMVALMDIPDKDAVIDAINQVKQTDTQEQIEARIKQAVEQARMKDMTDLKARELELKYSPEKLAAEISKIVSEAVKNNVNSAFAAMQAGEKIAMVPQVAPIADVVMQSSGWQKPNPPGDDPNYPQPTDIAVPVDDAGGVPGDTTPLTPESPANGANQGIETVRND